ncbi:alpha/beta hydrolase [Tychonema sp. LEGE 07199]|uniref:alpha/beta fold hydrolase n=1 Tax=unclassified Tychonema TaxID=2642144 RepID=UPI00187FD853|nr:MULTISPECIES: alpha/beta hydrolase [unclassified Tychonema]MBE9123426.1 alpha/beta hydrolase [Tychonema sp. LEGE 07199]MBE9131306.1 alpha/beta hydrolase [Tychonema sp. LEGE 07196]
MPNASNQVRFLTPKPPKSDRPLFIFLPGMDGSGLLLRPQISKLANYFDIRCLTLPADDMASWEVLVSETIALIEAEKQTGKQQRPVYLCGESFGGCLAMKIVLEAPQLCDRLILVNPASSFRQQPWVQWGSHLTQWLPANLYPLSVIGLLPMLASLGKIGRDDRRALLEAMQAVPQHTSVWRLALVRSFDVDQNQLRGIQQQTLVIASGADRLLPSIAEAKLLVKVIPNAEMVMLANSGHACLLETDVDLYGIMQERNFLTESISQQSLVRSH